MEKYDATRTLADFALPPPSHGPSVAHDIRSASMTHTPSYYVISTVWRCISFFGPLPVQVKILLNIAALEFSQGLETNPLP